MCQTLFYVPVKVFGVPLFGFGILFWIIAAILVWRSAYSLLITKQMGDFWSDLLVGFAAVFIVAVVAPKLNMGAGLPVRGYGVFLMLAIVVSAVFVIFRAKRKWNIPPEIVISIIVIQVIFGLIGARLFYVVEYWNHFVLYDPAGHLRLAATLVNIINLTQGGLMVFGSIIVGSLATLVYLRKKKLPVWGTMDIFAPALMLGIAIGRIGCFMNGCCFGAVCDAAPTGIVFPVASPSHLHQMEHGKASLGGFNLFLPEPEETGEKSLFHIKKNSEGLLAPPKKGEQIVVESVDQGSNPEKAGLKPGMTILRTGVLWPAGAEPTQEEIRAVPMVTPLGTRGFLSFLYDNGFPVRTPFLVLDLKLPAEEAAPEENAEQPKLKRIAFLPGPFEVRAVYPTQLFSTLCGLILCVLLVFLDRTLISKYIRRDGVLFALMLIFYSVCRFLIELLRTDESSFMGTGLSISQCVSLLVFFLSTALLILMLLRPARFGYEGLFPPAAKEE